MAGLQHMEQVAQGVAGIQNVLHHDDVDALDGIGQIFLDSGNTLSYLLHVLEEMCIRDSSNDDIVKSLEGCCDRFVVTGDAKQARTVKMATYEGFCAAMDIL